MGLGLSPKEFFKYCPKCGIAYSADTASLTSENLACKRCQYTFYHNPKTAVNAIILNERHEVLLAKRAFDPAKGTWDFPGGFVDWGEDPMQAIEREIDEELHVQFRVSALFSTFTTWYPFDGLNVSLAVIVYKGVIQGEPRPDDDVGDCQWFSLDQIPIDLAFPQMKELLERVKKEI